MLSSTTFTQNLETSELMHTEILYVLTVIGLPKNFIAFVHYLLASFFCLQFNNYDVASRMLIECDGLQWHPLNPLMAAAGS